VWLRALRLEDFRIFSSLDLELEPGLNFLFGPNGSGKTSILEAVSWLAVSRSLRGASESEVVRWGAQRFGVGGECTDGTRRTSIVLRYQRGGPRETTVDGEPLAKLSDLLGILRVAWFGPEDTAITKGGPAERRRLLDMALCQTDPAYLAALSDYRRALRQRNEALLTWGPDEDSDRVVGVWTEQLVKSGSRVVASRLGFLGAFSEQAAVAHRAIAPADTIALSYKGSFAPADVESSPGGDGGGAGESGVDEASVAERFRAALAAAEEDERRRGFTLVGPHRDDIDVRLNGRSLRSFGSQGQHRTAAIALKLGEAAMLAADGHGVTVLLDDVLSELDDRRAAALVDLVGGIGQALVTSTHPLPATPGAACASLRVEAGEVVRT
jgi:DNA replication and repair protein RecF